MLDIPFEIDTSGDNLQTPNRLFYTTNGDIENVIVASTKPSQERPAILKQKAKRYHELEKKFVPGNISYQLRKALGLGHSDIPDHVYRMRHLGYPPGWLKKAEIVSDNLSVTGVNAVVNKSKNTSVKYDASKLYEYPGFNTYNNYNYKYDYCHQRGFMPMQNDRLLDNFLTYLSAQHMLGKEATNIEDIRSTNFIYKDTDFNLPITPNSIKMSNPIRRRRKSSSMDLSDGEVGDEDENEDVGMEGEEEEEEESSIAPPKMENGTIVLVASTPKPSLDRFSEGINDHRLYENLPNSRGAYKKVLGVLKRFQP